MSLTAEKALLASLQKMRVDAGTCGRDRNQLYTRLEELVVLTERMEIRELHDELFEAFNSMGTALAINGPEKSLFDHIRSEKARFAPVSVSTPARPTMTPEEVVALMESSRSRVEWEANEDKVALAFNGAFPEFWFEAILKSGVARRTFDKIGVVGFTVSMVPRQKAK